MNGRFEELVTALIVSDIGAELRAIDAESVTLFAPTDYAFRSQPALAERLYENEDKTLLRGTIKTTSNSTTETNNRIQINK